MKNNDWLLGITAIGGILVAGYLYAENKRQKRVIKELNDEREHLKLLITVIKNSNQFDENVKKQIEALISKFDDIDPRIANELAQTLQLLQIGQVENAIEDLVKIMEYLLERKYSTDSDFKSWLKENKKKKDLHNLLEYSKYTQFISEIEFSFFNAIKTIRNKEDHTLDLKLDQYINASGLLTAIGAIMKIGANVFQLGSNPNIPEIQ